MAGLAISRVQKKRNLEFSKILAGNEAFGRSDMSIKKQSLYQGGTATLSALAKGSVYMI